MIVASNRTRTDCLDVDTNHWYSMGNFEHANRAEHCMMSFDGSIIVAGGNQSNSHLTDIMTLDTESMKWVSLTNMKQARSNFALISYKKVLYTFGGYNTQSDFIVDVERVEVSYDGKWESRIVLPMPVAFTSRKRPSALAYKERVLVTGMSISGSQRCGPILLYTPDTNQWEVLIQSPKIGSCDAVYLIREYEQLFIVSFIKSAHQWQSRVHECNLVCDDTQTVFTIVREMKQNKYVRNKSLLQSFQIGKKVFIMCNDYALETFLRLNDETKVISLNSYRLLQKVIQTSAVNVLALDWKKISLEQFQDEH